MTDPELECARWLWVVALILAALAVAVYVLTL